MTEIRLVIRDADGSLIRDVTGTNNADWLVEHAAMWKQRCPDAVVTYTDVKTSKPWTPRS